MSNTINDFENGLDKTKIEAYTGDYYCMQETSNSCLTTALGVSFIVVF